MRSSTAELRRSRLESPDSGSETRRPVVHTNSRRGPVDTDAEALLGGSWQTRSEVAEAFTTLVGEKKRIHLNSIGFHDVPNTKERVRAPAAAATSSGKSVSARVSQPVAYREHRRSASSSDSSEFSSGRVARDRQNVEWAAGTTISSIEEASHDVTPILNTQGVQVIAKALSLRPANVDEDSSSSSSARRQGGARQVRANRRSRNRSRSRESTNSESVVLTGINVTCDEASASTGSAPSKLRASAALASQATRHSCFETEPGRNEVREDPGFRPSHVSRGHHPASSNPRDGASGSSVRGEPGVSRGGVEASEDDDMEGGLAVLARQRSLSYSAAVGDAGRSTLAPHVAATSHSSSSSSSSTFTEPSASPPTAVRSSETRPIASVESEGKHQRSVGRASKDSSRPRSGHAWDEAVALVSAALGESLSSNSSDSTPQLSPHQKKSTPNGAGNGPPTERSGAVPESRASASLSRTREFQTWREVQLRQQHLEREYHWKRHIHNISKYREAQESAIRERIERKRRFRVEERRQREEEALERIQNNRRKAKVTSATPHMSPPPQRAPRAASEARRPMGLNATPSPATAGRREAQSAAPKPPRGAFARLTGRPMVMSPPRNPGVVAPPQHKYATTNRASSPLPADAKLVSHVKPPVHQDATQQERAKPKTPAITDAMATEFFAKNLCVLLPEQLHWIGEYHRLSPQVAWADLVEAQPLPRRHSPGAVAHRHSFHDTHVQRSPITVSPSSGKLGNPTSPNWRQPQAFEPRQSTFTPAGIRKFLTHHLRSPRPSSDPLATFPPSSPLSAVPQASPMSTASSTCRTHGAPARSGATPVRRSAPDVKTPDSRFSGAARAPSISGGRKSGHGGNLTSHASPSSASSMTADEWFERATKALQSSMTL